MTSIPRLLYNTVGEIPGSLFRLCTNSDRRKALRFTKIEPAQAKEVEFDAAAKAQNSEKKDQSFTARLKQDISLEKVCLVASIALSLVAISYSATMFTIGTLLGAAVGTYHHLNPDDKEKVSEEGKGMSERTKNYLMLGTISSLAAQVLSWGQPLTILLPFTGVTSLLAGYTCGVAGARFFLPEINRESEQWKQTHERSAELDALAKGYQQEDA